MSRAGIQHAASGAKTARGVSASGPRARVMVATPTYSGDLHHRYVDSLLAATVFCLVHKIELELRIVAGASLIQYARNQLVREFLEDDSFTHLMWIDADVGFDPRAIVKLLDHDKDVVGGVYPMKCIPLEWPYEPMQGEQSTALHRAKIMPGGFLLCSRHAVQTAADRASTYWHYMSGQRHETKHVFDLVLEDGVLLGEDVIFSRRLLEAGFDIWCDPSLHFRHCGKFEWRGMLAAAISRQVADYAPIPRELMRALNSAGTDDEATEVLAELFGHWGNTWAAPAFELFALTKLARNATRILETGCGLSTLVMAAANPSAEIHALEDHNEWADRVEAEAKALGLTNVHIHRAQLVAPDYFYEAPADLPDSFDLVFHDGPAFLDGTGLKRTVDTRLGLYARFADRIADAVLVIDDCEFYTAQLDEYDHRVICGRFAICKPKRRLVTSTAA